MPAKQTAQVLRPVPLRVRVLDSETEKPIKKSQLCLWIKGEYAPCWERLDDGIYANNVAPGDYWLVAQAPRYKPGVSSVNVKADDDQVKKDVKLKRA